MPDKWSEDEIKHENISEMELHHSSQLQKLDLIKITFILIVINCVQILWIKNIYIEVNKYICIYIICVLYVCL